MNSKNPPHTKKPTAQNRGNSGNPNLSAAQKVAVVGIYAAAAVVISAVEGMIPAMPFMPPGAKAGFSNIIVMFLAIEAGLPAAISVAVFKAVFALATRGVTAALMSISGGVISSAVIFLLCKRRLFGCIGIGVAGASAHNLAQLCVSLLIIGDAARFYLPMLMIFGIASGILTGFLLKLLLPAMHKSFYIRKNYIHKKSE